MRFNYYNKYSKFYFQRLNRFLDFCAEIVKKPKKSLFYTFTHNNSTINSSNFNSLPDSDTRAKKPKRELCLDLTNAIYGKANKHGYWVMNWKMLAKRISVVRWQLNWQTRIKAARSVTWWPARFKTKMNCDVLDSN